MSEYILSEEERERIVALFQRKGGKALFRFYFSMSVPMAAFMAFGAVFFYLHLGRGGVMMSAICVGMSVFTLWGIAFLHRSFGLYYVNKFKKGGVTAYKDVLECAASGDITITGRYFICVERGKIDCVSDEHVRAANKGDEILVLDFGKKRKIGVLYSKISGRGEPQTQTETEPQTQTESAAFEEYRLSQTEINRITEFLKPHYRAVIAGCIGLLIMGACMIGGLYLLLDNSPVTVGICTFMYLMWFPMILYAYKTDGFYYIAFKKESASITARIAVLERKERVYGSGHRGGFMFFCDKTGDLSAAAKAVNRKQYKLANPGDKILILDFGGKNPPLGVLYSEM